MKYSSCVGISCKFINLNETFYNLKQRVNTINSKQSNVVLFF